MSGTAGRQIKITHDGSHTVYIPALKEHYHSIYGAWQESEYVFIKKGFRHFRKASLRIFEMGFGTGLNAFLTCIEAVKTKTEVYYSGIDLYPLETSISGKLNYGSLAEPEYREFYREMNACDWDKPVPVNDYFTLLKIYADIREYPLKEKYDLVYFDAFAPDKQPELWQPLIFRKLFIALIPQGILVTYSAKGSVRRNLEKSGFIVTNIPGPPGKREIIKAQKGKG
ncbi:MAG: tRNA (5-methylaminomethyl-2-thiouridine)(34)-methyltransferase MnmD [Bacteroidales bacterium]|nr:MAG: tRNA (5-methylaminomethyl-2-thiouridine)(34)-methyltransferase MnmD [Bacteroidales bacterium]